MQHTWALIGFGGMGGWHYSNIKSRLPELNTKGAYDIRPEALKSAEEKGLYPYSSLDELLADKEVDLVTIATPNNFHKDLAIACLNAGKNVICEKPVTLNSAELEEIIAASEMNGKLFSIHQNRRWDRDYCIIKEIVASGVIGKPYFIESRVQGSRGSMHGWRNHKVNVAECCSTGRTPHRPDDEPDRLAGRIGQRASLKAVRQRRRRQHQADAPLRERRIRAARDVDQLLYKSARWHMSCTDGTAIIEDWSCKGKMVKLNTDAEMAWDDEIVYTEAGPTRTMAPRLRPRLQSCRCPTFRPTGATIIRTSSACWTVKLSS